MRGLRERFPTRSEWGIVLGACCTLFFPAPVPATAPGSSGFLENVGQLDAAARFSASAEHTNIYFTSRGLVLDIAEATLGEPTEPNATEGDAALGSDRRVRASLARGCVIRILFAEAESPRITANGEQPGLFHFLRGHDANEWFTGARTFSSLTFHDVWPAIDLVFQLAPGALVYDVVVGSGADLSRVRFEYEGADRVVVAPGAVHEIRTAVGTLVHRVPEPHALSGSIELETGSVAGHSPVRSFPMDWVTFLGGSVGDFGLASAVDALGRPMAAGRTLSSDFPVTVGAYDVTLNGQHDGFIAKLTPDGQTLVWSTLIGGTLLDEVIDLTLDSAGDVLIVGDTVSPDFPVTSGAFDTTASNAPGDFDVFVAKLSEDGDSLLWSTYMGAGKDDWPWSLTLDELGNVFLGGGTQSSGFPTTSGAYDETHNGAGVFEGFVSKLSADGSTLLWSTFLGGVQPDHVWQVILNEGRPIVSGLTESSDFPTTLGAFQTTYQGGDYDGFVAELSADGSTLLWSSFLGGDDQDLSYGLAQRAWGNVVVGGRTRSGNFPTTAGVYDETPNGGIDVFVLELDPTGSVLQWSTVVGGSGHDWSGNLGMGPEGCLVTAGSTYSDDFPTTGNAFDPAFNGGSDGFVLLLSSAGSSLLYSSYCGGSGGGDGIYFEGFIGHNPVTIDPLGAVILAGTSASSDFPTTEGAFDREFRPPTEAVVVKMSPLPPTSTLELPIGNTGKLQLACSPNPFHSGTVIRYALPVAGPVRVGVYDVGGRIVRMLENSEGISAGSHTITWDGRDGAGRPVTAGTYLCRVESRGFQESQRLTLLR